ncbi:MAG: AEC family transporter [Chloroflexota bacterium]
MSLPELFNTFLNNILPIMLISAAGFLLGKTLHIDSRSVGRISFYFFSPVLVFNLLVHSRLPVNEILKTGALTISVTLACGLLALAGAFLLKQDRPTMVSTLITSMFANNGNYGLPLIAFAFGQATLAHSSIYFVFSSLLTNTLGVLIASLGHFDIKQAMKGLFRIPTFYAVFAAGMINYFQLNVPVPLDRTISLAAGAGVPLMIMLLGLELVNVRWSKNLSAIGLSTCIRLAAGPLLGMVFTAIYGITGSARQAGIMEASMSAAVANTNLAAEYKLDSSLVAATVLISTILSPLTLTPLILLLSK